jgi:hypothetical protein
MTEILHSIHSRVLGIDAEKNLVLNGAVALANGGKCAEVGTPSGTGVTCNITKSGNIATLNFTLTDVAITHTDAAGSGSSGSLKIFDFANFGILPLGCRTNLTLTSDATLDPSGDAVGVFALGSVAANAADGALTTTEVDFAATKAFTLSSNTLAVGTSLTGVGTAIDGTSTAVDLYLNESCTAATSDATGVLTVTGTITLVVAILGDD